MVPDRVIDTNRGGRLVLNRLARGLLAGGLLGAVAGTMIMVRRRQRMKAEMAGMRSFRRRAGKALRTVTINAVRVGSALKSGGQAFANRMAQRNAWGRT